jgi:dihydroxyacid dehydratase/phosphogluconate dehydratase
VWLEIARQSARAVSELDNRGITTRDILTDKAIENAMVIHAAFGGSTNLLLHIPAIAHAAGCTIPDVEHWTRVNRRCRAWSACCPTARTITRPCAPSSRAACRR